MKIAVEYIIELVTRELVAELRRRGIEVVGAKGLRNLGASNQQPATSNQYPVTSNQQPITSNHPPFEPDMSAYKTPVLTEARLKRLNPMVREIIIPEKTVLTPGARDYIRRNNLIIKYKS